MHAHINVQISSTAASILIFTVIQSIQYAKKVAVALD